MIKYIFIALILFLGGMGIYCMLKLDEESEFAKAAREWEEKLVSFISQLSG